MCSDDGEYKKNLNGSAIPERNKVPSAEMYIEVDLIGSSCSSALIGLIRPARPTSKIKDSHLPMTMGGANLPSSRQFLDSAQ